MKRKLLTIMLAIALFAVFTGCSQNSGSNAPKDEPTPAPTTETVEETATEAPPSTAPVDEKIDFKGGSIRIGQWWGMENYLNEEEIAKQKAAEEKYNVKIEYVTVGLDQLVSRIITTSVAGQPFADIVMIPTQWALPKLASEGYIRAIDDIADLTDPNWNAMMLKAGKYDGKQYSFTDKDNNGYGLYYNKTMVEKLGIEDPYVLQEKGEWTWDKFLEMTKAATKDESFGFAPYGDDATMAANSFIYSNGGAVTTDDKITFDSPEALEAIQYVSDLYNVHKVIGGNFGEGKALFMSGARWAALDFNGSMADDWGYVFFPKGPKATEYVVPITVNMWHMMADVENPKAVMTVWKDLYERDPAKAADAVIRGEEANFRNEEGLNTLRQMLGNGTVMQYEAYDGFVGYYGEAIKNIMAGTGTAASELARIKPLAQAAIDVTLKK